MISANAPRTEQPPLDDEDFVVTKSIDWSYPTSENASSFGFKSKGCFTVSKNFGHSTKSRPPQAISGHATREEAVVVARNVEAPWNPLFERFHPDDVAECQGRYTRALHELTPFEYNALVNASMLQQRYPEAKAVEAEDLTHPSLGVKMVDLPPKWRQLRVRSNPDDVRGKFMATLTADAGRIAVTRGMKRENQAKTMCVVYVNPEQEEKWGRRGNFVSHGNYTPKIVLCSMQRLARMERLLRERSQPEFRVMALPVEKGEGDDHGAPEFLSSEAAPTLEAAHKAVLENLESGIGVSRGGQRHGGFVAYRVDTDTVRRQFAEFEPQRTLRPLSPTPVPAIAPVELAR